jgi:hypothetical protein
VPVDGGWLRYPGDSGPGSSCKHQQMHSQQENDSGTGAGQHALTLRSKRNKTQTSTRALPSVCHRQPPPPPTLADAHPDTTASRACCSTAITARAEGYKQTTRPSGAP